MAQRGTDSQIRVEERAGAPTPARVTETDFHGAPQKYLAMARDGRQVFVEDSATGDVIFTIGTNGLRIDVYSPELEELPGEVEAQCDEIDYEAWLR